MAVSQIHSVSSRFSEAFVQCNSSLSRFIEFGSRNRMSKQQKLLLIRTLNSRPPTTSFCVKCQPKPIVRDRVTDDGAYAEALSKLGQSLENVVSQICYILYPGDDSVEDKVLHLKQQYTLCSASLQDIIACFERRSGANANWEDVPEKVAV